jgi:hypothetical protein
MHSIRRAVVGLLLAASGLLASPAVAGSLSDREVTVLKADITELYRYFETGQAEPFVDKSHRSLVAKAGGREALLKLTRDALRTVLDMKPKFLSSEFGTPSQIYAAGGEEACIVPRRSRIEIQGKVLRTESFLIAVRHKGGGPWTYLDGAGLRDNPLMLEELLPELERGIVLPPNTLAFE